jgi:hypothetical protein
VFYSIADPSIYELCELVCGQIAKRMIAEDDIKQMFIEAEKLQTQNLQLKEKKLKTG